MSQIGQYPDAFYRVSIKAVIRNDRNEVLLVKEINNTNWNLPGGGMDHGENEYGCLRRELYEEIGYKGDFICKPIGIQPMYLPTKDACQLWVVYEVTTDNYDFSVGEESDAIEWFDPRQFKGQPERLPSMIYKFCVDPAERLSFQT